MRRLEALALPLLLFSLLFLPCCRGLVLTPAPLRLTGASPANQDGQELIIGPGEELRIENAIVMHSGDIIIDGGRLVLENATLFVSQSYEDYKYNITVRNSGEIVLSSSQLLSDAKMNMSFFDAAMLVGYRARIPMCLKFYGSSQANISISGLWAVELYDNASLTAVRCGIANLTCCGSSQALMVDSSVSYVSVAENASANFSTTVYVKVLLRGEPVKGASIRAYYNGTLVAASVTNSSGLAQMTLPYAVWRADHVDLYAFYTIEAVYGAFTMAERIDIRYEKFFVIELANRWTLKLHCVSPDGASVSGVLIRIYESDSLISETSTGESGWVSFKLYEGNYTVRAYKWGVEVASARVQLDEDLTVEVVCALYDLTIRVVNDRGRAIEGAKVTVHPMGIEGVALSSTTGPSGRAKFEDLPPLKYKVRVTLRDRASEFSVELRAGDESKVVVFDTTPPVIRRIEVKPEVKVGEPVVIRAYVEDEYGRVTAAYVCFRVDRGSWVLLEMSWQGDHWVCEIPGQARECKLEFFVEAVDDSGNKARSSVVEVRVKPRPLLAGKELMAAIALVILSAVILTATGLSIRKGSQHGG